MVAVNEVVSGMAPFFLSSESVLVLFTSGTWAGYADEGVSPKIKTRKRNRGTGRVWLKPETLRRDASIPVENTQKVRQAPIIWEELSARGRPI